MLDRGRIVEKGGGRYGDSNRGDSYNRTATFRGERQVSDRGGAESDPEVGTLRRRGVTEVEVLPDSAGTKKSVKNLAEVQPGASRLMTTTI